MSVPSVGFYIAFVIGLITMLIGIAAVAKPEKMAKKFGIAANGIALPYVMSTGVRDIAIGLIILILFYLQAWSALGASQLCLGIVALSDFLVVRKYGDKKISLTHLVGAVVVIVYGTFLVLSGQ